MKAHSTAILKAFYKLVSFKCKRAVSGTANARNWNWNAKESVQKCPNALLDSFKDFINTIIISEQLHYMVSYKSISTFEYHHFNIKGFRTWIFYNLYTVFRKGRILKRVVVCDGPISKFVCNISMYLCAKFGAFITKCTIVMIVLLCHYTIEDSSVIIE